MKTKLRTQKCAVSFPKMKIHDLLHLFRNSYYIDQRACFFKSK